MGRTIIYGPPASGKTRNAKALSRHYGHGHIIDCYEDFERGGRGIPSDALIIMMTQPTVALRKRLRASRVVHIHDALRALAGVKA